MERALKIRNTQTDDSSSTEKNYSKNGAPDKALSMLLLYKADENGDEGQVVDIPVHPLRLRRSLFVADDDDNYTFNSIYNGTLKTLFTTILSLLSSSDEQRVPNAKFHGLARVSSVVRHAFEACKKISQKTKRGGDEISVGEDVGGLTLGENLLKHEYIDFAVFKDMVNMLKNETLSRALWTDLTCICKYKYDLTTFVQGEDAPLPDTKEKGFSTLVVVEHSNRTKR